MAFLRSEAPRIKETGISYIALFFQMYSDMKIETNIGDCDAWIVFESFV
jgi:hypothetical protein